MSYDVYLENRGICVSVARHEEGGTYVLGGAEEAQLNITYNYASFYYQYLPMGDGLRWLNGKRAGETIESLQLAVMMLGDDVYEDYWAPTRGNAGHALKVLLGWAIEHPYAIWSVS